MYVASSTMPTVVTSPVGCPRFFVSQAVSLGLCPGTYVVPLRSVSSDLDTLTPVFELYVRLRERRHWDSDSSFPTEPVISEAHPYPHRNLKWLIEEIGVVEEMIHRRALSV
ncbi:hypothetical protein Taro_018180 [Colocasia esculenta]|uniref:Uncharacterized protein n=1 Tax=Colocasia esculenta TaxID=4460 RepID=A0A843UT44_COLES|nr:hypothetical protein [Colocasia esculenta]